MKKLTIILPALLIFSMITRAQEIDTAGVMVHKDPRVEELVKQQSAVNEKIRKASARTMRGFRLLVVNTNRRDEAIEAKTKVYSHFPELKSYLVYQSPYFKLKAGNFRTREEAEKYKRVMESIFPKGVFVIPDVIEVVPEKDEDHTP